MSPDRVIYSFVLGWVVLLAVLIALDWIGNPNRGAFRPKGDRSPRDRRTRKTERRRRRLENDASIRAALRDAYGASSLRLTWTGDHESSVRQVDDALVVDENAEAVDVDSREVITIDRTIVMGDPLPNLEEAAPVDVLEPAADEEAATETSEQDEDAGEDSEEAGRSRGWRVGGDPLSLTARGGEPAAATVRTRVWKNHGASTGWSDQNAALLRAGKAPRRTNPITGRNERAVVDVDAGRATWGSDAVDPFEVTS